VSAGRIVTVAGDVDPTDVGWTLPHEHTAISLWHVSGRWDYWELTRNPDVILPEVAAFREAGGSCIVDLTAQSVGRDPAWLREVSDGTDLHVVMGCGWYRGSYYPPAADIDCRSVDSLADELVREFEDGVGETGIRPGIIGEIGTDKPWLSPAEERVHRAAARAARRTGMAVTTHGVLSPVGLAQLRVFEEEGLDPARVVIGHADSWPHFDHYLAIVERGASIQFDFLGMAFTPQERVDEPRIIELLTELVSRGHAERILLSQDVCHNQQLKHYGGNGYTYLADAFLPRLREAGVTDDVIDTITVANPRRLLTISA
jgi:phosphotriesterase-related protein